MNLLTKQRLTDLENKLWWPVNTAIFKMCNKQGMGFPGDSRVKKKICLPSRTRGINPWVRKIPWRRKRHPTPVFLPGRSHGRCSLVGYSPWGEESDMTWWPDNNKATKTYVQHTELCSVLCSYCFLYSFSLPPFRSGVCVRGLEDKGALVWSWEWKPHHLDGRVEKEGSLSPWQLQGVTRLARAFW